MPFVPGVSVRILTHERARAGHHAVVDALLELVRREHLAGVTVSRAAEGYSRRGGLRDSSVVELGDDLPQTVEIVDRAERIEAALPAITSLVTDGTLTLTEVRLFVPDADAPAGDH